MAHFIMDNCIICGTCWDICPQDAVVECDDYYQITNHCDNCGKCLKACPNGAIANSVARGLKLQLRRSEAAEVDDV